MLPDQLTPEAESPLLEIRQMSKSFPGVQALKDVDLTLHAGEVLALLGENGAGKSTLIKSLGGVHLADSGTILIDGEPVHLANPQAARRAGIGIIYQEFNLIPTLSVRENVFLGHHPHWLKRISRGAEREQTKALMDRIGSEIDPEQRCGDLSIADQQIVEIVKALAQDSRIIIMDEPTAALSPNEASGLFDIIDELRSQGIGIIYISHRLGEIERLADRVLVLRDGEQVGMRAASELNRDQIIQWMVGRTLDKEFPPRVPAIGEPRLKVKGVSYGQIVRDVSFEVHRGEILGLAGLVGAGRTELARLLFAAERLDSGTISLDGNPLDLSSPRQAINAGICLLTEDRKNQGLILAHSAQHNFSLPSLGAFSKAGVIQHEKETAVFGEYREKLHIRLAHKHQSAETLSGGNQQKVVLAKWLQCHAEVIIFDEPTRGIDVGARFEIYQLLNELAAQGKAIIMISSELPEILGMSDRILVMREGQAVAILENREITQEEIMKLATRSEPLVATPQ